MTKRTLALLILACAAVPTAAGARPVKRHGSRPSAPTPPPTPPSVPSPPAMVNEPDPAAAPATPAPAAQTPSPPPPPEPAPVRTKSAVEVDSLVAEYSAIRDELFRSRAKAAVLGEALLKTQLLVTFRYEAGRAWPLKKITLRLDERPVYSADSVTGNEAQKIFETVAAPGRHVLTARVEASGTGEERISYATENSFGFDLSDGKLTRVELDVDETGSGAGPFVKKKEGSFDLRVRANVKSMELEKK